MRKSEKMLEQTLIKIAEMDNNLKEKLIKEEKEKDWEEEMQYLRNQAARQDFMHLANAPFKEMEK